MSTGEVTTLLDNQQQRQPQQEAIRSRRSHALRVAVGVVSALALVAGSCVAVELISENHQNQATATTQTSSLSAPAPANMEADLGWDTWCSMRASVQCLFSSDKDKCKEDILSKCEPEEENKDEDHEHEGDGSGSGSGLGHGSGSGSHHYGPEVGDPERNVTAAPHKKKHKKKKSKGTKPPAAAPSAV